MSERIDSASRLIYAPASTIYQAFATAEAMVSWLPPHGMTGKMLSFAFCNGGTYRLRLTYDEPQHTLGKTSEGTDEVEVRFVNLVPHECIEQTVNFESNDSAFLAEMRMAWILETVQNGTLVTVRCENVPIGIGAQDHQAGLESTLSNLAAFTESARK